MDRETKSSYKIIIEVSDNGQPPQSATRVLRINILDIDDHRPRFAREIVSFSIFNVSFSSFDLNFVFIYSEIPFKEAQPIEMSVEEEQPPGTIVGFLQAIDEDINENGAIDYVSEFFV